MKVLLLAAVLALPQGVTCDQVREGVRQMGKWKAIAWALEHGYSWGHIRAAKECLRERATYSSDKVAH